MSVLCSNDTSTENELNELRKFKISSQTLESKIEEIRHDHKNSLSTIGEGFDNSFGWGKAEKIIINLFDTSFHIIDNGIGFEHINRLKLSLLLGKKNDKLQLLTETGMKGKFGLGLPKGSIIVGNKITIITHISSDNKIYTCIADWNSMKQKNIFTPITRESTPDEIEEYNQYFGKGTYIKYENLLNECTLNPEIIHDYIKCLYKKNDDDDILPKITILKNHELYIFAKSFNNPPIYIDTTFSNQTSSEYVKKGYLIRLNDSKFKLSWRKQELSEYDNIDYIINVIVTAIDTKYIKESGFIKKKNDNLIGFQIFRNGRNVTPSKSLYLNSIDPSSKPYRDKGLRILLDFCDNIENTNIFDDDFKVSSLKTIDETCYYQFQNTLSKCMNTIGSTAEELFENRKINEKKKSENDLCEIFNDITNNFKNLDETTLNKYTRIIENLYTKSQYSPDIDNNDIIPFTFDKRNGLYKKFCESLYVTLQDKLNNPENYCSRCLQKACDCCTQCDSNSINCECEKCTQCSNLIDLCSCEKCTQCDSNSINCECEKCTQCSNLIDLCSCEKCTQCDSNSINCECEKCTQCNSNSINCECEKCTQCDSNSINCECEKCTQCANLIDLCECEKCTQCANLIDLCECEKCTQCDSNSINCECEKCTQCANLIDLCECEKCTQCDKLLFNGCTCESLNLNDKIKFIFKYSNNWNFEYLKEKIKAENDGILHCYPKSVDLIDKLYTLLK